MPARGMLLCLFALPLILSAFPAAPWTGQDPSPFLRLGFLAGGVLLIFAGVAEINAWRRREAAEARGHWIEGQLVVEEDVSGRYPACSALFETEARCWRLRCFTSIFPAGHPFRGERHDARACIDDRGCVVLLELAGRRAIPATEGVPIAAPPRTARRRGS